MPALAAVWQSSFIVPIVLSRSGTGGSSFSTELILTNRGDTTATVAPRSMAAFGGGGGTGVEALAPGEQKVIPDAIAYLIGRGIPIPASGDRGRTLQVGFYGSSSPDAAAATARTTTATRAPHPVGAAGLAYPGTAEGSVVKTSATLFGIRATSERRSNVAVYNPTTSEVTVRVTAFAGDGSGASLTKADDLTIPALGWTQFNGILDGTGFSSGWVTVERTGGQGAFSFSPTRSRSFAARACASGPGGAASYAGALRVRVDGRWAGGCLRGSPYRVAQSGRGTARSLHPRDLRRAGSGHRSHPLRPARS